MGIHLRGVAQLVARLVRDQEVRGSSPRTPIFMLGVVRRCGRFVSRVGESRLLHLPRVRPVATVCHWHTRPCTPIFA